MIIASVWCGASLSTKVLEFSALEMSEISLVGALIPIKLTGFCLYSHSLMTCLCANRLSLLSKKMPELHC